MDELNPRMVKSIQSALDHYSAETGYKDLRIGKQYSSGKRGYCFEINSLYSRQLVAKVPRHTTASELAVFQREYSALQAAASVKAKWIPRVRWYEPADVGREPVMLLDHMPGQSIRSVIGSSKHKLTIAFRTNEVLMLLRYTMDALAPFHQQGWIHGDLSPSNVMIVKNSESRLVGVSLIDFGSSRRIGDLYGERVFGTDGYYAPGLTDEGRKANVGDDMYALACLAYAYSTGSPPTRDSEGNIDEKSLKKLMSRSLRNVVKSLSEGRRHELLDSNSYPVTGTP